MSATLYSDLYSIHHQLQSKLTQSERAAADMQAEVVRCQGKLGEQQRLIASLTHDLEDSKRLWWVIISPEVLPHVFHCFHFHVAYHAYCFCFPPVFSGLNNNFFSLSLFSIRLSSEQLGLRRESRASLTSRGSSSRVMPDTLKRQMQDTRVRMQRADYTSTTS